MDGGFLFLLVNFNFSFSVPLHAKFFLPQMLTQVKNSKSSYCVLFNFYILKK